MKIGILHITIKVVDTFCRDADIPAYMYLAILPGSATPWDDENHQKTGFKLIQFLFFIM
jgi:hypothetical protein